jgi:hypothetical protein
MATHHTSRPLIKALGTRRSANAEAELEKARNSVLRWWWEYLRLSRDYWMVCQTSRGSAKTRDDSLARVYEAFGDVWSADFDSWWLDRGYEGFAELTGPPRVKQVPRFRAGRDREPIAYRDDQLWLAIPLTLTRATIMRQIGKILDEPEHQAQRPENRLALSTATFKVNPVRYRLRTLQLMHDVYCLHRELIEKPRYLVATQVHPDDAAYRQRADVFRIGQLLGVSPVNARFASDRDEQKLRHNRMRSTVGRFLTRSRLLIANVEIGQFPVFKPAPSTQFRFTEQQVDRHRELEPQWWALELQATMGGVRVEDAKRLHYSGY